jgi:CHAT domain-containing protein/Tfp pilus assembly protein PilF
MILVRAWVLFLLVLPAGNSIAEEPKKAVIVEQIQKNFEAERAGIREGDVILRWSRGDARGEIESPFDLLSLEIEQEPKGRVALEGFRGAQEMVWELGPNSWRIKTRPDFPAELLSSYLHAQDLARTGKSADATGLWREMAKEAAGRAPGWLASWIMFHAAELLVAPDQAKAADDAYQAAVDVSTQAGPAIRAQLFRAWAIQCEERRDLENAAKHFQQSREESQKLSPETLLTADNLNSLGRIAGRRGDLSAAEQYFNQALTMRMKLAPESLGVAGILSNLGLLARSHGDLVKADDYFRRALSIREKLVPGTLEVALTLNNLGLVAEDKGDMEAAQSYYLRAMEIRQRLNPGSLEAAGVLNNLGNVALKLGDFARSQEYQMQALEIRERLTPGSAEVAESYNSLGILAADRGELVAAEEYHARALEIRSKKLSPNSIDFAASLFNLGDVAWLRHDLARAEDYHRRALAIKEKQAPGSVNLARSLTSVALLAEERGDLAMAEEHLQRALQINLEKGPRGLAVAQSLNQLADLAVKQGHRLQAQDYLDQALKIAQEIAPAGLDIAQTFHLLGDLARNRGDMTAAEAHYRDAIGIREKLAPGSIRHAESLAALARAMWLQHRLDAAAQLFDQALYALENQTAVLGGAEDIRSGFRAAYAGYYSDYIDLLMAEKKPELAFQIFERSRGRTLMEMLKEASLDIRKGVDPLLLERERMLRERLAAGTNTQIMMLSGNHTEHQAAAIKQEIEKLLTEFKQAQGQIRTSSPGFAALTQPQSLSAREVREQLLDRDTVLLEYALGESHSYVWVLTQNSLESYDLPDRARIEAAATRLHKKMASLNSDKTGLRGDAGLNDAAILSQMVLAPVAHRIAGKRLLIVSDGALQYIPFAVLLVPYDSKRRIHGTVPLMVDHEIVNSPSASVLALVRQANAARKPAPMAVAVLADPVFDLLDPRVPAALAGRRSGAQPATSVRPIPVFWSGGHSTRSASDLGWTHLSRLPFSQREATAILNVTPPGQGMKALGFEASRAKVTGGELAQYRVVHFATHGLLNNEHPEFSGLVLSLVDEQGKPQNGFLMLQDIYNLNLPAELVVLSACETALGKEIRGEGLVGLTRGFMYAGATRVLASLWNVDDVATAELMARFYKAMEKDSMTPAAALRQAQIEMWRQKRWRSPYYWAGFQIQGEWN